MTLFKDHTKLDEGDAIEREGKDFFTNTICLFYLVLVFCKYPLLLTHFFPSGNLATAFFLITPGVLSILAVAILFLKIDETVNVVISKPLFLIATCTIVMISIIHFRMIPRSTAREFFYDLYPITIPLLVVVCYRQFSKLLLPFVSALWIFNAIHCGYQIMMSEECVGIAGNRNWNAGFLIASTPMFLVMLYKVLLKKSQLGTEKSNEGHGTRKAKMFFWLFCAIVTVFGTIVLFKAESRGALLSLITVFMLFVYLETRNSGTPRIEKFNRIFFPLFLVSTLLASMITIIFFNANIVRWINMDVRIPLWHGAINLFISHLFTGVGLFAYESYFAYMFPLELFLRDHYFASRYLHPHNQMLFIAGAYGLPGIIAFAYFYIAPIVWFVKRYKKHVIFSKAVFFAYCMLLLHSQVDKIAIQWPTSYLLLIFQGVLWYGIFFNSDLLKYKNHISFVRRKKRKPFSGYIGACVIFAIFINMLYKNFYGSLLSRKSDIFLDQHKYLKALKYKQDAVDFANFPDDIYDAGMLQLKAFKNYKEAYALFKKLENHPAGIVVHRNIRIAECLIFMNRKKEALKYLNQETIAFPLSSLTLYNKMLLEKELGLFKEAGETLVLLNAQLKFKGLKATDMKIILEYPELDNKFHLITNYRKKQSFRKTNKKDGK